MFIALAVLWFIIGYCLMLYVFAKIADELVLSDLLLAILGGCIGPIMIIAAAPYMFNKDGNTVIWKRKK